MAFDLHKHLLAQLDDLLRQRVARNWDRKLMSQSELSRRSGVGLRSVQRIYAGRPCSEETWGKLFAVAMDTGEG